MVHTLDTSIATVPLSTQTLPVGVTYNEFYFAV